MRKYLLLLTLLTSAACAGVVPQNKLPSVTALAQGAQMPGVIATDLSSYQKPSLLLRENTGVPDRWVKITVPGNSPQVARLASTITVPAAPGVRICIEPTDIPMEFSILLEEGQTTLDFFKSTVNVSHPSRNFDLQLGC